jgi:hypothetical protein
VKPQHQSLIGTSDAMQPVLADIESSARSGAKVLITGETSVGKEVVARTVHQPSVRQPAPVPAESLFLLRPLMLRLTMDTLLGDHVGALVPPPDPANMDTVARRAPARNTGDCGTNYKCWSAPGRGGCDSRGRTVGSGACSRAFGLAGKRRS